MRKLLILMLALLLLGGCSGQRPAAAPTAGETEAPTAAGDPPAREAAVLWTKTELPTAVTYDRMWEYSASAQTDDPLVIAELVSAIRALEIGEKSERVTEDYTDVLTFSFADGDTLRLEFEDRCWVAGENERYEAEGLGRVRDVLNGLIGEAD